ncbi:MULTISPECIES: hypothetical protein [unclassified Helicobacter]|nr:MULTISPECIES: hypothetical protein [unclassified Helicobacter]
MGSRIVSNVIKAKGYEVVEGKFTYAQYGYYGVNSATSSLISA